jgi:hypothetical protein
LELGHSRIALHGIHYGRIVIRGQDPTSATTSTATAATTTATATATAASSGLKCCGEQHARCDCYLRQDSGLHSFAWFDWYFDV